MADASFRTLAADWAAIDLLTRYRSLGSRQVDRRGPFVEEKSTDNDCDENRVFGHNVGRFRANAAGIWNCSAFEGRIVDFCRRVM